MCVHVVHGGTLGHSRVTTHHFLLVVLHEVSLQHEEGIAGQQRGRLIQEREPACRHRVKTQPIFILVYLGSS